MAINRVKVLPWPGIDRAYLCLSGKRKPKERFGEFWYGPNHVAIENKYPERETRTEPCITFLYDAGDVCAEWDGALGPIQLWFKAKPEHSSEWEKEPRDHWFYDKAFGDGAWSQMAVDEAQLNEAFAQGQFDRIFAELKRWADSRQEEFA